MKYLLTTLLLYAFTANAQVPFTKKYKDCDITDTCLYCGDTRATYTKNIAGKFQRSLDHSSVKWMSTSGRLYFEIAVDSTGHSCVLSIKDEVHMNDLTENIRRCINNLWDWTPAKLGGRAINSTVILELYFIGDAASVKFIKPEDAH